MNIYEEAIVLEIEIKENRLQLTKEKYRGLDDIKLSKIIKSKSDKHDKVIQALERAKKVEELLWLYRAKDNVIEKYTKNSFAYFSELERLSYEIKALEKELEEMK